MSAAVAIRLGRGVRTPSPALVWGGALTLAALVLRLYAASRSLWLDETISVYQVERPVRALLDTQVNGFHPPLYHLSLHYWIAAFGDSPLAVRSLSIMWSLVAIAALAAWSREAVPSASPLPAAVLAAVGPFAVWYGSEARMYAQLLALTALAGCLAWRLLGRGVGAGRLAGFALTVTALVYTHYFAMLFVATLAGLALAMLGLSRPLRARALAVLAGLGVALTAVTPWLVFVALHRHTGATGPAYPNPDLFSVLIAGLEMVLGFHSPAALGVLAAGWPLLCLLGFALLPRMRHVPWQVSGLVALTVVPPVLLVTASVLVRNVFDPRYLTVSVAPLYIMLGALWHIVPGRRARLAGAALLAALAVGGSIAEVSDPGNPKLYQLREAMAEVAADTSPGDALVFTPDFQRAPVVHYFGAPPGVRVIPAGEPAEAWRQASHGAHRVVLVSAFDHDALSGALDRPEAFRRYFTGHGLQLAKHAYAHTTVRVYRPWGADNR